MSGDGSSGEEPLLRPFLGRTAGKLPGRDGARGPGRDGARGPGRDDVRGEVRPYLLTGGRTTTEVVHLAMESVVVASGEAPPRLPGRLRTIEHESILDDCDHPCSVAEVSARRQIPLRVALVLVGDLVAAGLLEASTASSAQSDDVSFLERLIDGVSAL